MSEKATYEELERRVRELEQAEREFRKTEKTCRMLGAKFSGVFNAA